MNIQAWQKFTDDTITNCGKAYTFQDFDAALSNASTAIRALLVASGDHATDAELDATAGMIAQLHDRMDSLRAARNALVDEQMKVLD